MAMLDIYVYIYKYKTAADTKKNKIMGTMGASFGWEVCMRTVDGKCRWELLMGTKTVDLLWSACSHHFAIFMPPLKTQQKYPIC